MKLGEVLGPAMVAAMVRRVGGLLPEQAAAIQLREAQDRARAQARRTEELAEAIRLAEDQRATRVRHKRRFKKYQAAKLIALGSRNTCENTDP